jgi:hypothetical protein
MERERKVKIKEVGQRKAPRKVVAPRVAMM